MVTIPHFVLIGFILHFSFLFLTFQKLLPVPDLIWVQNNYVFIFPHRDKKSSNAFITHNAKAFCNIFVAIQYRFLASAVSYYLYNAGYVTKNAPSASEQPVNTGFQWPSQRLWLCFRMVNTVLTQSLQKILMIIHLPVMLNLLFGVLSHRCRITNPSSIFLLSSVRYVMSSLECAFSVLTAPPLPVHPTSGENQKRGLPAKWKSSPFR